MNHLIAMLRDADVTQTTDWELFQRISKNVYWLNTPQNSTNTEVWVKFEDNIQKYTFDIQRKLVGLSSEAHDG